MRIDILTIFPNLFDSFLNESLIGKALERDLLEIHVHDFRQYTTDKHHKVDDTPYGGGAGMVLQVEPIYRCLQELKPTGPAGVEHFNAAPNKTGLILLMTPEGELLQQEHAPKLAKLDQLTLICGRYEGFDERLAQFIDGKLSVGQYVLNGGELAAQVVTEAVSRFIPGVLGDIESAHKDTFSNGEQDIEAPQYTKPLVFESNSTTELEVPEILLSGHHANIEQWRAKQQKEQMPFSDLL